MNANQTEQEDKEASDSRQAKKQKWANDKGSDTSDNNYRRPKWIDWTKNKEYEQAWESKAPYKKAWDDASTKSEAKWDNKWVDHETTADKKTWSDSAAPADPAPPRFIETETPAASSWEGDSNWGAAESDSAAGEEAEEWRAYAKTDARPRKPKKNKEAPSWGKAKGSKGYDKNKVKDVKAKTWRKGYK